MSYTILYDKQFVRLSNGQIIPMVLAGSNNCYEITRNGQRRERNWTIWYVSPNFSINPDDLLQKVQSEISNVINKYKNEWAENGEPNPSEHFGYYIGVSFYGKHPYDLSAKQYFNFFRNGINKALTIDELDKINVHLEIYPYVRYVHDEKLGNQIREVLLPSEVIYSEDKYWKVIDKWNEWFKQFPEYEKYVTLNITYMGYWENILNRIKHFRRTIQSKREKQKVEQTYYYVLESSTGYLVRYIRNGYKYTMRPSLAKAFRTEQEANRYLKQIKQKNYFKADSWQVKRIDSQKVFYV